MDKAQLKRTYDLYTLASRDTSLHKSGSVYTGPCPFCGEGRDRFTLKHTLNGWRWSLRTCDHGQGGASWWDAIKYVQIREGVSFPEAIRRMGGELAPRTSRAKPQPHSVRVSLPSAEWQKTGWEFVLTAGGRMCAESGREGLRYLAARGLNDRDAAAHMLGFAPVFDPKAHRERPAIVIPHFDQARTLTCIQYRFTDDEPDGLRYFMQKGSTRVLWGMHLVFPHHRTLWVVEGEINGMSLARILRKEPVSIVSIGSESISAAQGLVLRRLAGPRSRFERVFVWADKAEKARAIKAAIGRRCTLLQSPQGQDANDLLRAGVLLRFVRATEGKIRAGRGSLYSLQAARSAPVTA